MSVNGHGRRRGGRRETMSKRRFGILVGTVAVALGAGAAVAAIPASSVFPDADGVFHACVRGGVPPATGVFYLVDHAAGQDCKTGGPTRSSMSTGATRARRAETGLPGTPRTDRASGREGRNRRKERTEPAVSRWSAARIDHHARGPKTTILRGRHVLEREATSRRRVPDQPQRRYRRGPGPAFRCFPHQLESRRPAG